MIILIIILIIIIIIIVVVVVVAAPQRKTTSCSWRCRALDRERRRRRGKKRLAPRPRNLTCRGPSAQAIGLAPPPSPWVRLAARAWRRSRFAPPRMLAVRRDDIRVRDCKGQVDPGRLLFLRRQRGILRAPSWQRDIHAVLDCKICRSLHRPAWEENAVKAFDLSKQRQDFVRTCIFERTAAAALQTAAAQPRLHRAAQAIAFMDLLVSV